MKRAKTLPHVEVSRQEFIRLFIEGGGDPKKADFQAKISEGLGSYVMIGDKMVKSIGEEKDGRHIKAGDDVEETRPGESPRS
jgi:hypothetical protein